MDPKNFLGAGSTYATPTATIGIGEPTSRNRKSADARESKFCKKNFEKNAENFLAKTNRGRATKSFRYQFGSS